MLKRLFGFAKDKTSARVTEAVPQSGGQIGLTEWLHEAISLHRSGNLPDAESRYRQVLQADPKHFDALQLLGTLFLQKNRPDLAEPHFRQALAIDPAYPPLLLNLGNALMAMGRADEAEATLRKCLEHNPSDAGAALALAVIFRRSMRLQEALQIVNSALAHRPDFVEGLLLRSAVHGEMGNLDLSICDLRMVLNTAPGTALAHTNLCLALTRKGSLEEALIAGKEATKLAPEHFEARLNYGTALLEIGRLEDAVQELRAATSLLPAQDTAWLNLGSAIARQGKWAEAADAFKRALEINPKSVSAAYNLGFAEFSDGRPAEAIAWFERVLELDSQHGGARWARCMALIPVLPVTEVEADRGLALFDTALAELDHWFRSDPARAQSAESTVAAHQPFYLAYIEQNHRDRLRQYGELCEFVMSRWSRSRTATTLPIGAHGRRRRVGIISSNICTHSVWAAIIKGMLQNLDLGKIELQIYYLGREIDQETLFAKEHCDKLIQGPKALAEWVDTIQRFNPDVLIYPEIGMHTLTTQLASLRLAPAQAAMWGHPHTTGLPTIDYFLSAEDFEPNDAASHYTETLVRLPRLGCTYPALSVRSENLDLGSIGLSDDTPILLCPGSAFKYGPRHDALWTGLAKQVGRCQIVFVVGNKLQGRSEALKSRLISAFEREHLRFDDHVRFVRWLSRGEFFGLMQKSAVFLDSPGFSGFNTVMQGVEAGVPVVSLDGAFMRGRLGSGVLRRLGHYDHIAQTEAEFIGRATQLALEPGVRKRALARMLIDREPLFADPLPMQALQQFLLDCAEASPTGSPPARPPSTQ